MTQTRVLYGATIFLSAFLLFMVEPMAAKALLPVLGGSSAVWVTCLVFFQGALLVGYGYAFWVMRRRAVWVHLGLLVAALAVLGLLHGVGMGGHFEGASAHPVRTIFLTLGATIGLPFVLLGSTSPLLQAWLARAEDGAVPYRLFALSNAGSLVALVMYPTLIEPRMTLFAQRVVWAAGFVCFAQLCGWVVWSVRRLGASAVELRSIPTPGGEAAMDGAPSFVGVGVRAVELRSIPTHGGETTMDGAPSSVAGRRRWMWFLLPMAAAMQLAAVTSHLSQDIAAIPLLWILPLAVYLVTFIVAFEMPGLYRRFVVIRLLAVTLGSLGYALSKVDTALPVGMAVAFYLAEIFVACWFCHAEVYALRPVEAQESTRFYLLVAAGGVVGTFLVGIASPLVFRSNYDLPIAFLVTAALAAVVTWRDGWGQRLLWLSGCVLLGALTMFLHIAYERGTIMRARNFYGSLRVMAADTDQASSGDGTGPGGEFSSGTGPVRVLQNGRIRHGTQMQDAERRRMPTTYYGAQSGVGIAMQACCAGRAKRVGVIGLGVGTLAAYGQPGDEFTFYEINPLVEPIARNLFTYLRDSGARVAVVEGDGRASLAREAPHGFDVLVVDAFSGDAIPLHLLTREAMAVYRRHLAPGGVIAFHVSNSYLDLAPEVGRLAEDAGMRAMVVEGVPVASQGVYRSTWVLVSRDADFFARSAVADSTVAIDGVAGVRLWTDDYSSLLPVLRWKE